MIPSRPTVEKLAADLNASMTSRVPSYIRAATRVEISAALLALADRVDELQARRRSEMSNRDAETRADLLVSLLGATIKHIAFTAESLLLTFADGRHLEISVTDDCALKIQATGEKP